jgi:hypothetical protein
MEATHGDVGSCFAIPASQARARQMRNFEVFTACDLS